MTDPVIRTEDLTRRFRSTVAVDHLSFGVPAGAIYALVGPNGAGKTTLIKLLMNILRPTLGRAETMGVDSRRIAGKRLERIGYVAENQEMPESMTVAGLLGYLRGFYPTWDRVLEERLLRRFALPTGRKLRQLSRGMRMQAAFVAALAYRPALLVLDEPFSGLDPLVRDELVETIIESAPETTVFLSSHDLEEIENVASHVGFLREGRLLFSEEIESLTDRFREVNVTLDTAGTLPARLPDGWLGARAEGRAASFVHSRYRAEDTEREVKERLPGAREMVFTPMNLRAIFLAVARNAHTEQPETGTTDSAKESRA